MKRLIDWIVGNNPGKDPVDPAQSAKVSGNIFLGRDLDPPRPDSLKVVRWADSQDTGPDVTTDRK